MTSGDDILRESLRDLIPDYQPSGDPFARVSASVRRRRARRRTLLAIGSAATVALIAAAVPTLAGLVRPPSGQGPAGTRADGPLQTRPPPTPVLQPHLVGQGPLGTAQWMVESRDLSAKARRCLVVDGPAVFDGAAWCFDDWQPGQPGQLVTWGVVRSGAEATAVLGVADKTVFRVLVKLDDGTEKSVRTVATKTDPRVRFFAFVVNRRAAQVMSMSPVDSDDIWMGLSYLEPHGGYPYSGEVPYSGTGTPSGAEPARAPSPP